MTILGVPPSYDDLVRRHKLTVLYQPENTVLTASGALIRARDGDVFYGGTPAYNAMHRLVTAWSSNAPVMALLFATIHELRNNQPHIEDELEQAQRFPSRITYDERGLPRKPISFVIMDQLNAGEASFAALSGGQMIVADALLRRLRADLGWPEGEWTDARPQICGVSIGHLATAAANAFRHADEWAAARRGGTINGQQKRSMDVLAAALQPNAATSPDRREWERVMLLISGGTFDGFANAVLRFANDVAVRVKARG